MRFLGVSAAAVLLAVSTPQDPNAPAGYLEVPEWWGTFAVDISVDETRAGDETTVTNRIHRTCNGSFHLDSRHTGGDMPSQGMPSRSLEKREGASWSQKGPTSKATRLTVLHKDSRVVNSIEKGEAGVVETSGERATWGGQGSAKPIYDDFKLVIDVKTKTYGLYLPYETIATPEIKNAYLFNRWHRSFNGQITQETRSDNLPMSIAPFPALTIPRPGRIAPLKLPEDGGVADLQGNATFHGIIPGRGMKKPATVVISWFLSPHPLEDAELVLAPEDAAVYEKWRPLANSSEQVPGAHLALQATLRLKNGGVPKIKARNITFQLENVSREPGVCINHPLIPVDRNAPDLKFRRSENMSMDVVGDDLRAIQHGPNLTQATVVVSSFDFGAFGELGATAILENGRELKAVLKSDPNRETIRIPKSREGSRIAEVWRTEKKAQGDDDSDEDDVPRGDGNKGDGISTYEEYRGFMEKDAWSDLDPNRKDFFIIDLVNGDAKAAYRRFEELSDLKVHHDLKLEDTRFKVVNFNYEAGGRHVDQHAVMVTCWAAEMESMARGGPGRPKDILEVALAGGATTPGATDSPAYIATIHELFHCCNVWHHGDLDRQEYWVIAEVDGHRRASRMTEPGKTQPIKLYRESAPETEIDVPGTAQVMIVIVGAPYGQNSGEEECVIRYSSAQAYEKAPLKYYFVPFSETKDVGTTLCWGAEGHGVNALSRKDPRPRYYSADAACKRGNCRGQICVNDGVVVDRRDCRPGRHPPVSK